MEFCSKYCRVHHKFGNVRYLLIVSQQMEVEKKIICQNERWISKLQNGTNIAMNIICYRWQLTIHGIFWVSFLCYFAGPQFLWNLASNNFFLVKIVHLILLKVFLYHYTCLLSSVFMNISMKIWDISAFNRVRNLFFWNIGLIK